MSGSYRIDNSLVRFFIPRLLSLVFNVERLLRVNIVSSVKGILRRRGPLKSATLRFKKQQLSERGIEKNLRV